MTYAFAAARLHSASELKKPETKILIWIHKMSKFWSDVVQQLTPYVPGEQPKLSNLVKLNTNENPYPPSPRAQEAIRREAGADLRLFPDPNADKDIVRLDRMVIGDGLTQ